MHRERNENNFSLGEIQIIQVENYIYVANMIGQRGTKIDNNGVLVHYEAIESCLTKLAEQAKKLNASVHMPRIGCGLAGGKWEKIEPLINKTLLENNIDTYIYDFN